jgi:hypothetical protein
MQIEQIEGNTVKLHLKKRCRKALELLINHPSVMPTTSKILDPHSKTAPYKDNRRFHFLFWTWNNFFIQVYYSDLSCVNYYFVDLKKKQCYVIETGKVTNLNEKPKSAYHLLWKR